VRIAIVTVSDSAARGERAHDVSGDAIAAWATEGGDQVVARTVVPDDSVAIVRALLDACDRVGADLVLTTGGTGVSARDVTPEATRAVIEREATSFTEWMVYSAADSPFTLSLRTNVHVDFEFLMFSASCFFMASSVRGLFIHFPLYWT